MHRLLLLVLWLLLPSAYGQEPGSLDVAEEADLHFGIAVEHLRAGAFEDALEHLLISNRLVPNRNVTYNIAVAYERLGRYDQAYRHYADYVTLETDPERRAGAEAAIARIRDRVALVRIETTPPGATVYVDRTDLGTRGTTPRTLALGPGDHRLMLELDGYEPAGVDTTVAVGEQAEASVDLVQILGTARLIGGPEGAAIFRDGAEEPLGTMPASVPLPPGSHVLIVSAPGYVTQRLLVEISAEVVTEALVELTVQTGTLLVDALERDSLVEIDGHAAGFTPAVLEVPVGLHQVRVSRPGFKAWEGDVDVAAGERSTLSVRLPSQQEVTAATRTTRAVAEAPASVSVISEQEIRAFGYQSVWDAVGTSRGVYQTDDLSYKYVGFRGFGRPGDYGSRVLVTLDGHTTNDDQIGASYVAEDLTADLGDVTRIEVVRGPGSALYGSNAIFGVVNVVTRDGDDVPAVHARITADSQRLVRARVGGGVGGPASGTWWSAAAFGGQGGDFYFPEWDTPQDGDGRSIGADGQYGGTFQGKAWSGDLTFQLYLNARHKRIPTGAFDTLLADPRNTTTDVRSFAEVRFEPEIGDNGRFYGRAYMDFYNYYGDFPYEVDYVASDRWSGAWAGVEPRYVAQVAPWAELTVGGEARMYYAAHLYSFDVVASTEERYLDEEPTQQAYSAYAMADLGTDGWLRANLGARYDFYTLQDVGGALSPRSALIFIPSERDVLKLMGGTAYRSPSPYELFYNDDGFTQVRPDSLSPERIYTGEAEYTRRFDEVTFLTVAAYYNRITHLVDTELTGEMGVEGELFRFANTDEPTQTVGFEWEVRREWRTGVFVAANHAMQRTRTGSLTGRVGISNSPEQQLSLRAAAPVVRGVATAATRIRAESPRKTVTATETEWVLLWDVTLTGDLPGGHVRYGLGVRNLLDWRHGHPSGFELRSPSVPQPGRSFYASFEARL